MGARILVRRGRAELLQGPLVRVALVVLLLARAEAQAPCFEAQTFRNVGGLQPSAIRSGDLDGDGDADLAVVRPSVLEVLLGQGDGTFGAAMVLGAAGGGLELADFDGDGLLDVATGSGSAVDVRRNLGGGAFAPPVPVPMTLATYPFRAVDLDADGDVDLAAVAQTTGTTACVALNAGGGTFAAPIAYAVGGTTASLATGDVDGDGDVDLVVGCLAPNPAALLANQGSGTFVFAGWIQCNASLSDLALGDLDGDGDLDVLASDFWSEWVTMTRNLGGGAFAPPVTYFWGSMPTSVALSDLDGDGALDAVVGYANEFFVSFARNLGNGSFASFLPLATGAWPKAFALPDIDGDGDLDVVTANYGNSFLSVLRACRASGTSACAGDGSGTSCPCANDSPPGTGVGCTSSIGVGGRLRGTGSARIALDGLVLRGDQMPANATALYFQGTQLENGGAGTVFHDGLTCTGGTAVRLGTTANSGGASSFPGPGDPAVSVRGGVTVPGTRFYQAWYRNSAVYCTPGTSNATNALRVLWAP